MSTRDAEIKNFLAECGWAQADRRPLAGDASARRYERLHKASGETAVLMDAPPESGEDTAPFVAIARHLARNGFSAPTILAHDRNRGLVLLEDLGDDLYAQVCERDRNAEFPLYERAVDLLLALRDIAPPDALAPYDGAVYLRESCLLTQWYLPAATGRETPQALAAEYDVLIRKTCALAATDRPCLVLRDYHAENLLWLPSRPAIAAVGLLDFQDALKGHPAYDLVSLLEDARRDTSDKLRATMIKRYLAASGDDRESFLTAYAALGAQRNLKIIGIFSRLWLRDGKPAYLDLIPRVWGHLQRDLEHPALAALRVFINRHVPPPDRAVLRKIKEPA